MTVSLRGMCAVLIHTKKIYSPSSGLTMVSTDVLDDVQSFLERPLDTADLQDKIRELVSAVKTENDARARAVVWTPYDAATARAVRERAEKDLVELYANLV